MRENTPSLLSFLRQALGVPLGAIPLSLCRIQKPYLLKKHGLSESGTAILMAIPYMVSADASDQRRNLSLYTLSRDYHGYFEELEKNLCPRLKALYPSYSFALYADHSPIAEVDAAARCGLGVVGTNGLLITETYGSFVFLGGLFTDMPPTMVMDDPTLAVSPAALYPQEPPRCENCGACATACPGQCLPHDRDTCISALTQKKGSLTEREEALLKGQALIWGCDTCQLVCPHNREVLRGGHDTPLTYFQKDRLTYLTTELLKTLPDEVFRQYAFAWRGRDVIIRNLQFVGKEDVHDPISDGTHGKR